jgi:hypothetical protein
VKPEQQRIERELDVGGTERPPIVPAHAASQMKSIPRASVLDLPSFRKRRSRLEAVAKREESVVQQAGSGMHTPVRGDGRIQMARVIANRGNERTAVSATLPNARRREHRDDRHGGSEQPSPSLMDHLGG